MSGAARVGAELRAARERLGWDLPDLAASLRIRESYLEAIEDGRIGDLPGTTYALGFLRSYASALGLQPEEVARRFRAAAQEVNRKTELTFPAPVPQRGAPAGALVLLGVVVAAVAYIGWYQFSGNERTPVQTIPPVPPELATAGNPAVPPVSSSPQVASMLPSPGSVPLSPSASPAAAPATGAAPTPPPAPGPGASRPGAPGTAASGAAASNAAPAAGSVPAGSAAPANPAPGTPAAVTSSAGAQPAGPVAGPSAAAPAPAAPPSVPPAATPAARLELRATADAWMQVRQKHGRILLNRVLHAGESWPVPGDAGDLLLTTGNASGTRFVVDGGEPIALGPGGSVRRDLVLDPNAIKAGRIASAHPAKPAAADTAGSEADRLNAAQLRHPH
jgi:cytoskeleton protein RodZ